VTQTVYLVKLRVVCSCGAPVMPDPSLPVGAVLHECAECRILQGWPLGEESLAPDAVVPPNAGSRLRGGESPLRPATT
jgi:hypothetical protein